MRRLLSILLVIPPFFAGAQSTDATNKGIHFEEGANWKEVVAKAKKQNKYIFVDCYATWCGPCKQMDKEVYPQAKVGEFFNSKFISFKLQFDKAETDNEAIKRTYADAEMFHKKYPIMGYPTFLFFTPDGKLMKSNTGVFTADPLISYAKDVIDPKKNYYEQLAAFRKGKVDLSTMSFLALRGQELGDSTGSAEVSKVYITSLKNDSLLTKSNIEFMQAFTKKSTDRGFSLFYNRSEEVNAIMKDDTYAQTIVSSVIYTEMIRSEIKMAEGSGTQPDWEKLLASIQKRHNPYYAERSVFGIRLNWASKHKNWAEHTKYLVMYQEKFGTKNNSGQLVSLALNNMAWDIFLHSDNNDELNTALKWSGRAVLMLANPNWMDTYANLLYKLGRKDDAIMWQEFVAKQVPSDKEAIENLEKMKKGLPTWK